MRINLGAGKMMWGAVALAAVVGACVSKPVIEFPHEDEAVPSKITHLEALTIAEGALQGFNDRDYARFSAAWADSLRAGIDAGGFGEFRDQTVAESGLYLSILDVRRTFAETDGYVRWLFLCQFERQEMVLSLVFPQDGQQVTGIQLVPAEQE